jgi:hypothetical protein
MEDIVMRVVKVKDKSRDHVNRGKSQRSGKECS